MGAEPWLIHDCRRGLGLFAQGRHWRLETIETGQPLIHAEGEKKYQQLWRTFFTEIAIPERRNPQLQKQFLPMKYWRYLVEMENKEDEITISPLP
jgi:probable DNA metabolism protein